MQCGPNWVVRVLGLFCCATWLLEDFPWTRNLRHFNWKGSSNLRRHLRAASLLLLTIHINLATFWWSRTQVPCALSWDASLAQALKGITENQESLDAEHFGSDTGTRYTFDSKSKLLGLGLFPPLPVPPCISYCFPWVSGFVFFFPSCLKTPHRSLFRASCSGIQWKEQEGLWRWADCTCSGTSAGSPISLSLIPFPVNMGSCPLSWGIGYYLIRLIWWVAWHSLVILLFSLWMAILPANIAIYCDFVRNSIACHITYSAFLFIFVRNVLVSVRTILMIIQLL